MHIFATNNSLGCRWSRLLSGMPFLLLALAICIVYMWPLPILIRAVRQFSEFSAEYKTGWFSEVDGGWLVSFTLIQAAVSSLITICAALPVAWLLVRASAGWQKMLCWLLLLPLFLPSTVVVFALRSVFNDLVESDHPCANGSVVIIANIFISVGAAAIVIAAGRREDASSSSSRSVREFSTQSLHRTVSHKRDQSGQYNRDLGTSNLGTSNVPSDVFSSEPGSEPSSEPSRESSGHRGLNDLTLTVLIRRRWPSIILAALVTFLLSVTNFAFALLLGHNVRTVETEAFQQAVMFGDHTMAAALALLQVVIVSVVLSILLVTRFLQRSGGHTISRREAVRTEDIPNAAGTPNAVYTSRPPGGLTHRAGWRRSRKTRQSTLGTCAAGWLVLVFLTLPAVGLVLRSLRSGGNWSLANYRMLFPGSEALLSDSAPIDDAPVTDGIGTVSDGHSIDAVIGEWYDAFLRSVVTAFDATVLALAVGIIVAFGFAVVSRHKYVFDGSAQSLLYSFATQPRMIWSVVIGVAICVGLNEWGGDFALSSTLVAFGKILVVLPFVIHAMSYVLRFRQQCMWSDGVNNVDDPRIDEFHVPKLTYRQKQTPLNSQSVSRTRKPLTIVRMLVSVAVLTFVICLGQFTTAVFLARPDSPTLPVLLGQYSLNNDGLSVELGFSGAVLFALVTLTLTFFSAWVWPNPPQFPLTVLSHDEERDLENDDEGRSREELGAKAN